MNRVIHDLHNHEYAQNLDTSINLGSALTCNFNSSGQILYVGTGSGEIIMIDVMTKFPIAKFPSVDSSIVSVSSTLDQEWLLSTTTKGTITRYHIPSLSIDCQIKFPAVIQWSQICPTNKDICIISLPSPLPTCIINIAMEKAIYGRETDFNNLRPYEFSSWLNSLPSRSNLSLIPWLIDPRLQLPRGHQLIYALETPQKLSYAPTHHLPDGFTPPVIPKSNKIGQHSITMNNTSSKDNNNSKDNKNNTSTNSNNTSFNNNSTHTTTHNDTTSSQYKSSLPKSQGQALLQLEKLEYVVFASFSPLGDKISFGTNRGYVYIADVTFLPNINPNPIPEFTTVSNGAIPGMPIILQRPSQQIPINNTTTNEFITDPITNIKNKVCIFPNGIVLTKLIMCITPERLSKSTPITQIQFSHNLGLNFIHCATDPMIAVCREDGYCITYNVLTGAVITCRKLADVVVGDSPVKVEIAKKAVFSPANSHLYLMYIADNHTIALLALDRDSHQLTNNNNTTTNHTNEIQEIAPLLGPINEHCYDICAHPYLPIAVSIPSTGRLLFWSTRSKECWSAFNPVFQSLEDNLEYVETENDFDVSILPTHQGHIRKLYSTDHQNCIVNFNPKKRVFPSQITFSYELGIHPQTNTQQLLLKTKLINMDPTQARPNPIRHEFTIDHFLVHLVAANITYRLGDIVPLNDVPNNDNFRPQIRLAIENALKCQAREERLLLKQQQQSNQHNGEQLQQQINENDNVDDDNEEIIPLPFLHSDGTPITPTNISQPKSLRHQFEEQYAVYYLNHNNTEIPLHLIQLRDEYRFYLPPVCRLHFLRQILTPKEQHDYLLTAYGEPIVDPLLLNTAQLLKSMANKTPYHQVVAKNNISSGMGAAVSSEIGMNPFNRLDSHTTLGRGAGHEQLSNPIYTLQHIGVKKAMSAEYPMVHGPGIFKDPLITCTPGRG